MNVAAGIVLYNPSIERLRQGLCALKSQVQRIYCFDNDSTNRDAIRELLLDFPSVVLIKGDTNLGIAQALNQIVNRSDDDSVDWLLTLDQDSVVSANMFAELLRLANEDNVLIVCPQIVDRRRKNEDPIVLSPTHIEVEFCITSGSFIHIKRTIAVGGFLSWLFIGLVDNEFCVRVRKNGYRIIQSQAVVLDHELGDLTPSLFSDFYLWLGSCCNSNMIKKLSYRRSVDPTRLYYATRNMIRLNRLYPKNSVSAWSQKTLLKNCVSSVVRGKHKFLLIKAIARGIMNGKHPISF